jgi:RimJ/RimL family protein N-acetyltransferase
MYELDRAAFDKTKPLPSGLSQQQRTLMDAVWAGHHVGRIFVNDRPSPTSLLLYAACDFIIFAGDTSDADFNRAWYDALTTEISPGAWRFFMDPAESWDAVLDELFAGSKIHRVPRYTFTLDEARFRVGPHADWRRNVPAGYDVRRYDQALAAGAGGLEAFWGDVDLFLKHGVGVAVMHGDEVVSRCHTVFVGAGEAEIGIETSEAHRRRGLATLAASAFIEASFERNLEPAWSCWFNNEASVALAEHLGFVRGPDVPMVIVEPPS